MEEQENYSKRKELKKNKRIVNIKHFCNAITEEANGISLMSIKKVAFEEKVDLVRHDVDVLSDQSHRGDFERGM